MPPAISTSSGPAALTDGIRYDALPGKVRNELRDFNAKKYSRAPPVVLKLNRPVVAHIATLTDWPLILIDLYRKRA
jgi:hypothetical protein